MDIDIDLPADFDPMDAFPGLVTRASMVKDGKFTKHPCGVYFENIPKDSLTGLAAIPYQSAEDLGYTKIDFLHLNILNQVESKQQIRDYLNTEPDWNMLRNPYVVEKLFHLSKQFDLLQAISPTSVIELADCLALIRPGKYNLREKYMIDPIGTRALLYKTVPGDGGYTFKKSHAIAYATVIVLQLHLIAAEQTK